jgi:hypothetical protein
MSDEDSKNLKELLEKNDEQRKLIIDFAQDVIPMLRLILILVVIIGLGLIYTAFMI